MQTLLIVAVGSAISGTLRHAVNVAEAPACSGLKTSVTRVVR